MVTVVVRLPRQPDPAVPWPRWRTAAILVAGALVSGVGWLGYDRVAAAQAESHRLAAIAAAESRDADLQALDGNQGRALGWLVVYRCDSGQLHDDQLCDAARKITR